MALPDTLSPDEVQQLQTNTPSNGLPDTLSADEVKAMGGIAPTINPNVKSPSLGGKILRGALQLPAKVGTSLTQAAETVAGKPLTEPFSGSYLGRVQPLGADPSATVAQGVSTASGGRLIKSGIGAGLEAGSYLVGGEGAAPLVEKGVSGLAKDATIQGIKTGATAGAMQGAGGALQNNAGVADTAIGAVTGGAVGGVTGGLLGAGGAMLGKAKNALFPNADALAQKNLAGIKDTLTPKPTVAQAKLAETQGRLIKGQTPTLFKAGTPDKIATSEQQLKSILTTNRLIPNAGKMDAPTLHAALDSKISETAQKLKPQMEATPIKPETISNVQKAWKDLKAQQLETADATEEPNILKSQQQFEARLQKINSNKVSDLIEKARSGELNATEFKDQMEARTKKIESSNMNDLWEAAKSYDASVPDNVKQANSMSPESLQNKKTMWMQNRSILRNAINDSGNGLGSVSQKAFSDMKDMYDAQSAILSKAKVDTKIKPSLFSQAIHSPQAKIAIGAAKIGAGLYAGDKVLKNLTGLGL